MQQRFFGGNGARVGRVPGALILGRAALVYYPAPLPLWPGGPPLIPNFGEVRGIR